MYIYPGIGTECVDKVRTHVKIFTLVICIYNGSDYEIVYIKKSLIITKKGHKGQLAPRCRAVDAMIKKSISLYTERCPLV